MVFYFINPTFPCNSTASADKERDCSGRAERLYLRGSVQTTACQAGHRGYWEPSNRHVATADGPHQGND